RADLRDLRVDLLLGGDHRVAQGFDRVAVDAVVGERLDERALGGHPADLLRLEAEQGSADVQKLIELEEALELGTKDVDLHLPVSSTRSEGPSGPAVRARMIAKGRG